MQELERIASVLTRNRFNVQVARTAMDAANAVLALIPNSASVGFGGSTTAQDLGLYEALEARGNAVFWHWRADAAARDGVRKQAAEADYYLLSANALTEEGELVNTDGSGNRVSAMFFGPKNVIFIVGKNKIVKDYAAAIDRIRNVAAPKNAVRLQYNTPCAVLGHCTDCDHPQRMCSITGVLHRPTGGKTVHVILVDEDLGY
jgi:L-lactate utilization protein LutB